MRVLFLSVTAGEGHNATARSQADYFESQGHECVILNTLKYISPLVAGTLDKGYIAMSRMTPKSLGTVYNSGLKNSMRYVRAKVKSVDEIYGPLSVKKLGSYIKKIQPDVIICTHVFSAILVSYARKKGAVDSSVPVFGIVTDFTIHPFWEQAMVDYYVTASSALTYQAAKRSIPEGKLLPFGIPIHPKFTTQMSKAAARAALGLKDKPTILVMRGSFGFGKLTRDIQLLDQMPMDVQVLVVCGSNERTRKKLELIKYEKDIHIYGFVNNIEQLMDAADIAVTKPGGLTTSECLARRLPMVLMSPIPGVEDRNLMFFLNHGLALWADEINTTVDEVCMLLLQDHALRENLIKRSAEFGKPYAAKDLANFILDLLH
ncbi:MAG: MGDG synthase family glycosyltransferase [Christensenellales bacterium]|jgi:processive 1,2-diacylglycerol beta-glucosyltransferase